MEQVFRAESSTGRALEVEYDGADNHGLWFCIDDESINLDLEQTDEFLEWVFDNFVKVGD